MFLLGLNGNVNEVHVLVDDNVAKKWTFIVGSQPFKEEYPSTSEERERMSQESSAEGYNFLLTFLNCFFFCFS